MSTSVTEQLTTEVRAQIDHWVAKFPAGRAQSAILSALTIAQHHHQGWLSEDLIRAVADYLQIPEVKAFEVATFYSMFELKPVGRHKLEVCNKISCMLCGAGDIVKHLKQRLGIEVGETTADGRFTLKEVECLGACAGAPMMMVDEKYHENLTPESVDKLLDELE